MSALRAAAAPICLGVVAITAVLVGLMTAQRQPGFALVGPDPHALVVELVLVTVSAALGITLNARHAVPATLALGAAAFAAEEAATPEAPFALAFTLGLIGTGAAWPLLALAVPAIESRLHRATTSALIAAAAIGGLGPAFTWQPRRHGCSACPANVLAFVDHPAAAGWLAASGAWLLITATSLRAADAVGSLRSATPVGRRAQAPGLVALAAVIAGAVTALSPRLLGSLDGAPAARERLLSAVALAVVAGCGAWPTLRRWRRRRVLDAVRARAVATPRPGALEAALGAALGDPSLRLGFGLPDGALVDRAGLPFERSATAGLVETLLEREGVRLGLIEHRQGVLDDRAEIETLVQKVGLAFEHERAQAEAAARARDLRASRRRIVEASDEERRRLEHDLHDGAQQQLVSLIVGLQLLAPEAPAASASALAEAAAELTAAIGALRALAHGLFPPGLRDEGLGAAIEDLQLAAPSEVELLELPARRAPGPIEATAYLAAALAVAEAAGHPLRLAVRCDGETLAVRTWRRGPSGRGMPDRQKRAALAARVAALDGTIEEHVDGQEVLLPCEW